MTKNKCLKFILSIFSVILIFSTLVASPTNAQEQISKTDAINSSTYYSIKDNKVVLNEQQALEKNSSLTSHEIQSVKNQLNNLTETEINKILIDNGYDLNEIKLTNTQDGHANWIWLIPVVTGIVVAGGIIFSAMYFSHKEKMALINKCYSHKGRPVIDSRDKAGAKGTTNSGSASKAGGYKFECKK